jgi:hypothetical protein
MTPTSRLAEFLDHPGLSGPFGALMDEYARAALELCAVFETVAPERFTRERPDPDPEMVSLQAVGLHVATSAHNYATYLRRPRNLPWTPADRTPLESPGDLRPRLAAALRYMEGALAGLYDADESIWTALRCQMSWGPVFDPEMLLEHAIVHLLRHRRQVERWPG